jgi:predicted metal-dependent peptidase
MYINKAFELFVIAFAVANGVKLSKANGGLLDLSKAIRSMILNPDRHMAYYSRVIARMARQVDKTIPYMAVGISKTGWVLFYNPAGIEKMTFDQLCYVMKHEILHVILKHHSRSAVGMSGKPEISELDNVSMDLSINGMLGSDMGLGGVHPGEGKFADLPKGKSYEWYYKELYKKQGGKGGKGGKGKGQPPPGGLGGMGTAEGPDGPLTWAAHGMKGQPDKVQEAVVNAVLAQAWKETKAKGDMPAELEAILEEVMKSKYNWKAELRNWAGEYYVTGQRLSRKRMNRRNPIFGMIPGYVNEYCAKIMVALDTSGSMDKSYMRLLMGEVKSMGIPVIFVQCDAECHGKPIVISPYKKCDMAVKGGGGTDFRPVFDLAKKENCNGVIYLTDMYGTFPEKETIRTLWVSISEDQKGPFGKTIYLPLKDEAKGED